MEFKYTRTDNLEVMRKAVNYNAFLISLIAGQGLSSPDKILTIGASTKEGGKSTNLNPICAHRRETKSWNSCP